MKGTFRLLFGIILVFGLFGLFACLPSEDASKMYGVRGVPTKVLISKDGTIICVACRSIDIMLEILFNTST